MRDRGYNIVFSALMIFLLLLIVSLSFIPKTEEKILFSPNERLAPIDVSVTINSNNAPVITDYYPVGLSFDASGDDDLYFNVTFGDLDGDSLSVEWFVDDNSIRAVIDDDGFDEFNFNFGCDVSGDRVIRVEVSDGQDSDSVIWNINLALVACGDPPGDDPPPGGGGPGPDGDDKIRNFTLSRELVEVGILQNSSKRESVVITNNGDLLLKFDLSLVGLNDLLELNVNNFSLSPNDFQVVDINVDVSDDESPGVKTASLVIKSGSINKYVNFIIEVISNGALFDLKSELVNSVLTKEDVITAVITMTDISNLGEVDVVLEYFIKDFENNETKLGEENLIVNGNLEIERTFEVPEELELGNYVFYAKLNYQGNFATSSDTFKLTNIGFFYRLIVYLILIVILILIILLVFYALKKRKENSLARSVGTKTM